MRRTILPTISTIYLAAGVTQATTAHATEHETAPVRFTINDTRTVQSDLLSLPLTFSLISGVAEDVGVVTTVSSRAVTSYVMEGESTLAWPVAGTPAGVYHRITPRSHASVIDVDAELDLQLAVQGRVFGSFFTFTIVSQNAYFTDEIRNFTPFMLPFQPDSTNIQLLEPRSTNGSLRFPLTIPVLSSGVVNLSTGATFRADPVSRVEVRGESLTSRVEQGPSIEDVFSTTGADLTAGGFFQHPVVLDGQVPEVNVAHEWASEIATALGYMLGVDLVFQVEVFGFPLSFDFNLWEQQFDLLPFLPESTTTSAGLVSLPLPVAEVSPVSWASAGTTPGQTILGSVTVENVGAMALAGDALVLGTAPFTITPTSFVVPPGSARTLQVSFTPVAIGAASATLRIVSNDPAAPEIEIALTREALGSFCGDGIIDAGEACDDGASNSDTTADACRSDCTLPTCGDGVVDAGEACDDGEGNDPSAPGACRTSCQFSECGDGIVEDAERCDNGAMNSDVRPGACRLDCTPARCGDRVVDPGEACDDGSRNSDTRPNACRTDCGPSFCGDGVVDAGEACDDGADNSSVLPGACRDDCQPPRCGDGVVDPGEACDPSAADSSDDGVGCTSTCTDPSAAGQGAGSVNGPSKRGASCAGGCGTASRGSTGALTMLALFAVVRRRRNLAHA